MTFGPSPLRLAAMSLVTAAIAALQGAHPAERAPPDAARLALSRSWEPILELRPVAEKASVVWKVSTVAGRTVGRLP